MDETKFAPKLERWVFYHNINNYTEKTLRNPDKLLKITEKTLKNPENPEIHKNPENPYI